MVDAAAFPSAGWSVTVRPVEPGVVLMVRPDPSAARHCHVSVVTIVRLLVPEGIKVSCAVQDRT